MGIAVSSVSGANLLGDRLTVNMRAILGLSTEITAPGSKGALESSQLNLLSYRCGVSKYTGRTAGESAARLTAPAQGWFLDPAAPAVGKELLSLQQEQEHCCTARYSSSALTEVQSPADSSGQAPELVLPAPTEGDRHLLWTTHSGQEKLPPYLT